MADKGKDEEQIKSGTGESGEAGTQEDDTEGHFMLPDTGAAQVLANSRSRDIERQARIHMQKRESRPNDKRGR